MNAQELETAFLARLGDSQDLYEQILETQAWLELGFDTFGHWWDQRVRPAMNALSMRPTREIAAAVVERVRQEEVALPPAQRRTQRELGEMVGQDRRTVSGWKPPVQDHSEVQDVRPDDLEPDASQLSDAIATAIESVAAAIDQHLPADPDDPHREWRRAFLAALGQGRRPMQFDVGSVADRADGQCVDELRRLADDINSYANRVVAAWMPADNVRHLRAI